MALSKSDNAGSNVTNLDDVRKLRNKSPVKPAQQDSYSTDPDDSPESLHEVDEDGAEPQKVSNRRFDKVKVERIKGELARGEYKIDYLHVADKFIEHERYS